MKRYIQKQGTFNHQYDIEIFPNEKQKAYIERCFGIVRYVWNWALNIEKEQYELYKAGKSDCQFIKYYDLVNIYREARKENVFLAYLPYESARYVIKNLITAYECFFSRKRGKPQEKTKKDHNFYFPLRNDTVYFSGNKLKIPGLDNKQKVLTNINTPYILLKDNPKYYSCEIYKDSLGKYHFHYSIVEPIKYNYFIQNNIPQTEAIGIDLNVKNSIVCSNGSIYKRPNLDKINKRIKRCRKATYKDLKLQKMRQKELEKHNSVFLVLPSKNAMKRRIILNKAYKRKANIIRNFVCQSISKIIKTNPKAIVMEGFNAEKMMHRHYISKSIYDCNFGKIRELMIHKCEQYNIPFIKADNKFKSSQICSVCGSENTNFRHYHTFHCKDCGHTEDRDLNAAKNLAKLAKIKLAEEYDYSESFEIVA